MASGNEQPLDSILLKGTTLRKAIATTAFGAAFGAALVFGAPAVANAETATPAPTASTTEQVTETEQPTHVNRAQGTRWGGVNAGA